MSSACVASERQTDQAVSCDRSRRGYFVIHSGSEVARVLDEIAHMLAVLGHANRDIFATRLALEEALVNAVRHGNKQDVTKSVYIQFSATAAGIIIQVRDEGDGFDSREVPDPLATENLERSSGRGLLLLRTLMSKVWYNRRGNSVTLFKLRQDCPVQELTPIPPVS